MLDSVFRTVIFYTVLMATIRLMGKRQIGQMEPSELVVTMLIANLASIPIENMESPLWVGLLPIATVLIIEVALSILCLRSILVRRLLCGKPVILIENGRILQDQLRAARINLDELSGHLREKDVLDPGAVQFAILETNGNLSVFPYPKEKPASAKDAGIQARKQYLPVTIISDGYLMRSNLQKAGKDEAWVERVLRTHGAAQKDVFLLTVDAGDHIYFCKKD